MDCVCWLGKVNADSTRNQTNYPMPVSVLPTTFPALSDCDDVRHSWHGNLWLKLDACVWRMAHNEVCAQYCDPVMGAAGYMHCSSWSPAIWQFPMTGTVLNMVNRKSFKCWHQTMFMIIEFRSKNDVWHLWAVNGNSTVNISKWQTHYKEVYIDCSCKAHMNGVDHCMFRWDKLVIIIIIITINFFWKCSDIVWFLRYWGPRFLRGCVSSFQFK